MGYFFTNHEACWALKTCGQLLLCYIAIKVYDEQDVYLGDEKHKF